MRSAIDPAHALSWRRLAIMLTALVTMFAVGIPTARATNAPVATDDSYSVDEDATLAGNVITDDTGNGADSDADADTTLTVTAHTAVSHGSLIVNSDGSFTYTPDANYNGSDSFTYTLSDSDGTTANDTATVTVTVNPVNDDPVASNDSATTAEDTAVTVDVVANDSDIDEGDTLTVTAKTDGAHGTVGIDGDNTITYTPDADYNGSDSFTYTVSDGTASDTATVSITIDAVNDGPAANNDSATTTEGTAVTIQVLANDTDTEDDDLTIAGIVDGSNGTTVTDGTRITYTPDAGFTGEDSFSYTVSDGTSTDIGSVTVTVTEAGSTQFEDVEGLSAETVAAIERLIDVGITTGTSDTMFSPAQITERWQMALFLTRLLQATGSTLPTPTTSFADLDGYSAEARTAMNQLAELGISTGTSTSEFSPSEGVTRWQMALFIVRTLEAAGLTLPNAGVADFADLDAYPADVREAVATLVSLGVTTGTSETTYSPEIELPRWQMALFITRAIDVITG